MQKSKSHVTLNAWWHSWDHYAHSQLIISGNESFLTILWHFKDLSNTSHQTMRFPFLNKFNSIQFSPNFQKYCMFHEAIRWLAILWGYNGFGIVEGGWAIKSDRLKWNMIIYCVIYFDNKVWKQHVATDIKMGEVTATRHKAMAA